MNPFDFDKIQAFFARMWTGEDYCGIWRELTI
jgi:hypothetical protein